MKKIPKKTRKVSRIDEATIRADEQAKIVAWRRHYREHREGSHSGRIRRATRCTRCEREATIRADERDKVEAEVVLWLRAEAADCYRKAAVVECGEGEGDIWEGCGDELFVSAERIECGQHRDIAVTATKGGAK